MGCTASQAIAESEERPLRRINGSLDPSMAAVFVNRRRLTAKNVFEDAPEKAPASANVSTPKDELTFSNVGNESVTQLVEKKYGKSAWQYNNDNLSDQGRDSNNKAIQLSAESREGYLGFTSRRGLKPKEESPNQDSWSVMRLDGEFSIYSVCDGHGLKGHDVANYVTDMLPKLIVSDARFRTPSMPDMITKAYRKTQQLLDDELFAQSNNSGTTCTMVVHDHASSKLTISHVADSTAVLARFPDASKSKLTAHTLTRDHKPDLPDEKKRIEKAGGRTIFDGHSAWRVYEKSGRYPGLNMSRSLGDLLGHKDAGLSCEPEVTVVDIAPEDKFLLLCSDGVWEFMSPQEAVDLVASYEPRMAMEAVEQLAQESWNRWMKEEKGEVVDDITVVLVYLQTVQSHDAMMGL